MFNKGVKGRRPPKLQIRKECYENKSSDWLKGKRDGETYLIEPNAISRIYIENRQVLAETTQGEYHLGLRLYQVLEKLPSHFLKISQSEIVNLKEIERFNITPNGLVEIHLKNKETTYSSRRYLKSIKEKLQWKNNFLNQAQLVSLLD